MAETIRDSSIENGDLARQCSHLVKTAQQTLAQSEEVLQLVMEVRQQTDGVKAQVDELKSVLGIVE